MRRWMILLFCFLPLLGNAQEVTIDKEKLPLEEPKKFTDEERDQFAEFVLKGIEEENKNRYLNAIALYTRASKVDEESPLPLIRRGVCRARLNQNKEAADDLWAAIHLKPKTVSDFATLAWLYATSPIEKFRNGAVAVAFGQRALRESESIEHYDVLAAGYAEMNNFEQAKNTLERGIKYFSDNPRVPDMKKRLDLYKQKKKYREDWSPVR
ncbi:MAG: hypothetical protein ACOY3I_08800 [Verrucomicrobiota bacterium]